MQANRLLSKLLLVLIMISISYQTKAEKIIERLENPLDDLVGLESEISELFNDLSGGKSKLPGQGLEVAIADLLSHDFKDELANSLSLED